MSTPRPRSEQFLRYVVMAGLALTCLKVWLGPLKIENEAYAQIPDSGLQRKQQLDEARRTNELLADIKRILEDHTLKVRMEGADNQPNAPISVPRTGQ